MNGAAYKINETYPTFKEASFKLIPQYAAPRYNLGQIINDASRYHIRDCYIQHDPNMLVARNAGQCNDCNEFRKFL